MCHSLVQTEEMATGWVRVVNQNGDVSQCVSFVPSGRCCVTDSPAAHLQDCVSVPLAVGKDKGKLSKNFFASLSKIKLEYTVSCLFFPNV